MDSCRPGVPDEVLQRGMQSWLKYHKKWEGNISPLPSTITNYVLTIWLDIYTEVNLCSVLNFPKWIFGKLRQIPDPKWPIDNQ